MVRILLVALVALAVLAGSARAENGGTALPPPPGVGGATPAMVKPKPKPKPNPKKAAPKAKAAPRPSTRPRRKVRPKTRPRPAPRRPQLPAPPSSTLPAPRFPVLGPHTFGGPDSRFGAPRTGHVHQGQDVAAAAGTPIVAPRSGIVIQRANQPGGAGLYLVIHGDDGRDYVFMHLQPGSLRVDAGQRMATGQAIAAVGNTGDSYGPHLHFEIWVGGWQARGGHPIDPLPALLRWDAYS